jgi:hypothetical protein
VSFEPRELFRILNAHGVRYVVIGNLGATLYGSPLATYDADICPSRDRVNLDALAAALREMGARVRAPGAPGGLAFACDAEFLGRMKMVNLVTAHGDLDLSFEPSGTEGYDDLSRTQSTVALRDGLHVPVAALEDIIRSKEAANREKDRLVLPTLRLLLAKRREQRS